MLFDRSIIRKYRERRRASSRSGGGSSPDPSLTDFEKDLEIVLQHNILTGIRGDYDTDIMGETL